MQVSLTKAVKKGTKVSKDFYFAQIPIEMIKDVSPRTLALYAVIYGYCSNWKSPNPVGIVDQKTLSRKLGCCIRTVKSCMRELHKTGWATVKQTGLNCPNAITLHGKKKNHNTK